MFYDDEAGGCGIGGTAGLLISLFIGGGVGTTDELLGDSDWELLWDSESV